MALADSALNPLETIKQHEDQGTPFDLAVAGDGWLELALSGQYDKPTTARFLLKAEGDWQASVKKQAVQHGFDTQHTARAAIQLAQNQLYWQVALGNLPTKADVVRAHKGTRQAIADSLDQADELQEIAPNGPESSSIAEHLGQASVLYFMQHLAIETDCPPPIPAPRRRMNSAYGVMGRPLHIATVAGVDSGHPVYGNYVSVKNRTLSDVETMALREGGLSVIRLRKDVVLPHEHRVPTVVDLAAEIVEGDGRSIKRALQIAPVLVPAK